MPKVKPLGTPGMKAKATAKRESDARAKRIFDDLLCLKIVSGVKTEEEFATQVLGMSYSAFRRRKARPELLSLPELWQMNEAAKQYGRKIRFGLENEGESV